MTEKFILYTLLGIAISAALAFLTKSTGKSVATNESGQFNLRMNKLYGILGVIGLLFGLLFLIFFPLTAGVNDSGVWIGVILMLLIFWGAGIPCLMYYRNHRVTFSENAITVTNMYGKSKEIKWSAISDIRFNAFSELLVMKSQSNQVKVHQHLVGLSKLIEFIENKMDRSRIESTNRKK